MRHVIWSCSTFLPSIIKIFQRVFDLQIGYKINELSLSNITKGDNAKSKKGRVVILVRDRHLVLFYISAKYHQNIPKGFRVTEQTQNLFQIKQRVITPKVRKPELSILYATGHLHFYQVSSKYSKGYSSYRAEKKFYADANGIRPKNNMLPLTPSPTFGRGRGGRGVGHITRTMVFY